MKTLFSLFPPVGSTTIHLRDTTIVPVATKSSPPDANGVIHIRAKP